MVLLEASDGGSSSGQPLCQICRKDAAKYTCPSCNLRYCSIDCFRSENHVNCSEAFYKNSIVNDVRDREDVDPAEKVKMLDMLKRIQEMGEDDLDDSDDDAERDTLATLAGLDLDNMSPEEILKHLSPEQRREFEEMLADPTKAAGLLDLENDSEACWWLQDDDSLEQETSKDFIQKRIPASLPRAKLPKSAATATALRYNLIAILAAYALTIRVHGSDGQATDKQEMFLLLLPFISQKSTLVLKTLGESIDYVLGNTPEGLITNRRKLLLLLLTDITALLHNPKIRALEEDGNEKDKAYLALSDYHAILSVQDNATRRAAYKLAAQKILYYASNLGNFERELLESDTLKRKQYMEAEEAELSQFEKDAVDRKNIGTERLLSTQEARTDRPKIEELDD